MVRCYVENISFGNLSTKRFEVPEALKGRYDVVAVRFKSLAGSRHFLGITTTEKAKELLKKLKAEHAGIDDDALDSVNALGKECVVTTQEDGHMAREFVLVEIGGDSSFVFEEVTVKPEEESTEEE